MMDDEALQAQIRKFLRTFGVTAHREIADAVRGAVEAGEVEAGASLPIRARVGIEGVAREITVDGELELG